MFSVLQIINTTNEIDNKFNIYILYIMVMVFVIFYCKIYAKSMLEHLLYKKIPTYLGGQNFFFLADGWTN